MSVYGGFYVSVPLPIPSLRPEPCSVPSHPSRACKALYSKNSLRFTSSSELILSPRACKQWPTQLDGPRDRPGKGCGLSRPKYQR